MKSTSFITSVSSVNSSFTRRSGLSEPYQRTACGVGTGWANEFETVRVDLPALARANPDLDLADVRSVELVFDAASGRIGVDDLALEMDR